MKPEKIHVPWKPCAYFLMALALAVAAAPGPASADKAGRFDYYALTLSWSPTYCLSDAGRNDRRQCGAARRYSFVVHGLWPQFERGWPQNCRGAKRYVPNRVIQSMLDIMPSKRLVIHEWRKHGTCSGLSAKAYFNATRELFARIKIPARYITPTRPVVTSPQQLVGDFVKTNPWLTPGMLSVQCGNRRDRANLRGLRICFTRDFKARRCGANEKRRCRANRLVMPPVR